MHFCRFSCSLSILICLTFDVLGYLWRFGVFKKTHYQAADHQGGEAPRGPVVLARVGPQILTKHHKFCAAPSAHVSNSSASMKQNPQLIFINRKGVRHLPSGVPPAPKPQQPGENQGLALNGVCIIIAGSVFVKAPSCSRLMLLISVWALALNKQLERGRFIPCGTIMMAVCALPAPGNGDAGNGADTTAARLFRI